MNPGLGGAHPGRRWRRLELILAALSVLAVQRSSADGPAGSAGRSAPELVMQTGHVEAPRGIAVSPDGRLLASLGDHRTLNLWEVAPGREVRVLTLEDDITQGSAAGAWTTFSADGQRVSAVSAHGCSVWDVRSGRRLGGLSFKALGKDAPRGPLGLSPDGSLLALRLWDKVGVYDVETRRLLRTLLVPENATGLGNATAISRDARLVATAGGDCPSLPPIPDSAPCVPHERNIVIWDIKTGQETAELVSDAAVNALAFSDDGRWLVAGGGTFDLGEFLGSKTSKPTVTVWNSTSWKKERTFSGNAQVESVAFSPDSRWLAMHDATGLRLWDTASGWRPTAAPDSQFGVSNLAFGPEGRWVARAVGSSVEIRTVPTFQMVRALAGYTAAVASVAMSPNARWLAAGSMGMGEPRLRVWDVSSSTLRPWDANATRVAFSPDGRWLAAAGSEAMLWDMATWDKTRTLKVHGSVRDLAFSADSRLLAVSDDEGIGVVEVASGREQATVRNVVARSVVISPNSRWLSAGYGVWDNAINKQAFKVWDAATGREIRTLGEGGILVSPYAVAVDARGQWLAAANLEGSIKIYDTTSWQELRTVRLPSGVGAESLASAPDGNALAVGGSDGTIHLLDVASGRTARTLAGHTGPVNEASFDSSGRILASASEDGSVRLWDPSTGEALAALPFLMEQNEWLVTTPDGLFDGSAAGWRRIIWRFGNDSFQTTPVEAFFSDFYHPGLLADVVAGKRPRAPRDISQLDRSQPLVGLSLREGGAPGSSSNREVVVKVAVADAPVDAAHPRGSGARDVRLFRNGSLVKVWRGDVLGGSSGAVALEARVPITAGPNHLTSYAFNSIETT